jgi:hypothetical protein
MRYFALALILVSYCGFGAVAFGLTPAERETVTQMRDSLLDLRGKLEAAQTANASALSALSAAAFQTSSLVEQAKVAADRVAALAAERDTLTEALASAEVKYVALNRRYQTAQLIIAIVSAFLVGLFVLQFTHNLQPPYGIIVPLGAGAAAFSAIYIIL